MKDLKVSLRQLVVLVLPAMFLGSIFGGVLVLGMDWGAYSNLMREASNATKRGEVLVIFDFTTGPHDLPVIVNEVFYANRANLKLKEIQSEESCVRDTIKVLLHDPVLEVRL